MLNRVRQTIRTFTAASGRRFCQLVLVAQAGPAIRADGHTLIVAAAGLVVVLLAGVVLPAVWSAKPSRRRDALAVLDRLIRWKGGGR